MPKLNQLRAFEAAARHLSFKLAADELHVTHAAISHQIKALEEELGVELFRRVTRGVKLTSEAEAFASALTANFKAIAEAAARMRGGRSHGPLRVSSVPVYAMRILMPKLEGFRHKHPQIEIEINLELALADFSNSDAAVRYGRGPWAELTARLLHRDIVAPMCAPALVKGLSLPMPPERLLRFPVLQSPGAADDWKSWLSATGHRGEGPQDVRLLENRGLVLDYLANGGGIALADLRFAAAELETGRLIRLHPAAVEGVNGIYLVHPRTDFPDPRISAFGTWLATEAAAIDITQGCPWEASG